MPPPPAAVVALPTPAGPARVQVHSARPDPDRPDSTVVLGHGAGGGIEARDLRVLASALPGYGAAVLLVEQPWRVAGKRVAPAPARLDEAWCAVLAGLGDEGLLHGRLIVGGRSAGARVACRTATRTGAHGCLALAFPLHPPGRPERSRLAELLAAGVPTLVVQGERDAFGGPAQFPAAVRVVAVPGADHGFAVPRAQPHGPAGVRAHLVLAVAGWLAVLGEPG